jgi:hypothetical protein
LSDSNSYGTQVQTDIDNNINNIIDGTRGTFWTRNVYLAEAVPKVTTVLDFDLGQAKDINYIIVEGATELPFYIESIEALAPDGHAVSLLNTETEVESWARIDFDRVMVKSVKVTFAVHSYVRAEYFIDRKATAHDVLSPTDSFDEVSAAQALGPLAAEVVASEDLVDILNIPTGNSQQINSFLYPFALDNVWFGNSQYADSGIFVSKPLKGNDFGVIAVQASEEVGSGTTRNSIEYEIIKRDLAPKYKETRFPIPSLGQTSVVSERLILTKREENSTVNDAGALRFCPWVDPTYTGPPAEAPVLVYKNGELLACGADYHIAINLIGTGDQLEWVSSYIADGSDARVFSDYKLNPAKMWIKIVQPDSSAVYTVSYDIRTSDTYIDDDTMWLDKDKHVFLSDEGHVYFKRDNPDISVKSELYLQITLRRNTASQSTTPELDEYAVLGATYNAE